MAFIQLHDHNTVCMCLYVLTPGRKIMSLLRLLHIFICILSFQNYHELQPEGDPGSSVRSESTPTLHVSTFSIFDNHVSRALKGCIMICTA